jgi:hypothetical protein
VQLLEPSEFPHDDVEPNPRLRLEPKPEELPKPLLRLEPIRVELPKPLFLLNEELPGSEYEGKLLLTPPLWEHVPRPEFEL